MMHVPLTQMVARAVQPSKASQETSDRRTRTASPIPSQPVIDSQARSCRPVVSRAAGLFVNLVDFENPRVVNRIRCAAL